MRFIKLVSILVLAALPACAPFSDHAELNEIKATARAAKNQAEQAFLESQKARDEADRASEMANLPACTSLNTQHCAELNELRSTARAAKNQAEQAFLESQKAREEAEKASELAKSACPQSQGK